MSAKDVIKQQESVLSPDVETRGWDPAANIVSGNVVKFEKKEYHLWLFATVVT